MDILDIFLDILLESPQPLMGAIFYTLDLNWMMFPVGCMTSQFPACIWGLNAAYIKDRYPDFYLIWIEGHENRIKKIPYPTSILQTPDGGAFINYLAMQCKSHKQGAAALDSDDEAVTAEEIAGNLMGDISRHHFSQSTFSQSNVPNCTVMKDIMYVNDLNPAF